MSNNRKRLPGSEKLTRPEDINALSKYLGDIKKTQEEHTVLDQDNLEVPGITTGRIPEINGLYDSVLGLDVNKDITLDDSVVGLETSGKEIDGLYDSVIGLDGTDKEVSLEESAVGLETSGKEVEGLYDSVIGLDGTDKDINLDNSRVDLEKTGEGVEGLYDSVIVLDAEKEISLENKRLDIENEAEEIALDKNRLELKSVASEIELGDKKVGLDSSSIKDPELSDTVIDLKDVPEDIKLGKTKLDLKDAVSDIELQDEKLPLVGENKKVNLSDYIDSLFDDREVELENKKLELNDEGVSSLSDVRIEGPEEVDVDLEDTKLGIKVDGIEGLSDERVDLNNNPSVDLENKRLDLKDSTEVELSNERIELNNETEVELGNKRIELNDETEVKLSNKRVELDDNNKAELSNKRIELNDETEVELSKKKLELDDKTEVELSNKRIELNDETEVELSKKKLELDDKTEIELSNERIGLNDEIEVELSDKKLELNDDSKITELGDKKLELEDESKVTELSDKRLELDNSDWDIEKLGKELEKAPDDQKYEKALEIASSLGPWGLKVSSLISSVLSNDSVSYETAEWFDSELKKLLEQMGAISRFGVDSFAQSGEKAQNLKSENAELEGTVISRPDDVDERGGEREEISRKLKRDGFNLSDTLIQRPIGLDANDDGVNDNEVLAEESFTAADKPNYVYGKWGYGGNARNMGYQTIPKYQLPSRGLLDAMNVSNYIRYGVESLFNLWNPKTKAERVLKPMLLNESLALLILAREQLEKLTKSNRERLPGDDMGMLGDLMSGGVSGALNNLKDNAKSALQNTFAGVDGVDKLNPLNRPRTKLISNGGVVTWVKEVTKGFDKGNNRQDPVDTSIKLDQLGKNLGNNLKNALIGGLADMDKTRELDFVHQDEDAIENELGVLRIRKGTGLGYINNPAMIMTLMDLCNLTNPKEVDSLEALLEILKRDDSYITTPSKFGTIEEGRYGTMTLDTNSYWEVVIEPFCHTTMNGGFSFLPAIEEINLINKSQHGVTTRYSKWLPIANFELQKSKITNKSLGLYDGEIVYPITSELSNELRMTIVDDQYKSWRTYFQKCADVSVYSSEAHELSYYSDIQENTNKKFFYLDDNEEADEAEFINADRKMHITVVDKTKPLVALYKNITFLVKIYIMTPQYGTIRRFKLLCVLKDFEESYSGDIDAGGYDLNLSFSIVGENPPADSFGTFEKADTKKSLDEMLGSKEERELLNQTPKKKGGLIKLL